MRILIACMMMAVSAAYTGAGTAPNGETYRDAPFLEEFSGKEIDTTIWEIGTWKEHGGQTGKERVFIRDGVLHMQFVNDMEKGYLNSAIQTHEEFLYGKWETRIRPSSVPGVLNSFYTIDWEYTGGNGSGGKRTKQEIDIELLTRSFGKDKGEVHLAIHGKPLPTWDTRPDIPLDFNPSDAFHVWGFEITPGYVEWSVDGTVLQRYIYSEHPIAITAPYQIKLNVWTDTKWIKGPPEPGVVCTYLIDWIKFTPLAK